MATTLNLSALEAEFEKMDRQDGAEGPAPVEEIVRRVRKVRKGLLTEAA